MENCVLFLTLVIMAVPSLGRPVEGEIYDKEEDYKLNVKEGKIVIISPEQEKGISEAFGAGIPIKPALVDRKPFELHIEIPHIFDMKLFTGAHGHRLGIGILPGYAESDVSVIKEKY